MTGADDHRPHAPTLLFVYGTLRPACTSDATRALVAGLEHAGRATIRGTLHDLGDYPALVAGTGVVHGDLLSVRDAAILDALDAYEGCHGDEPLYERTAAVARRADGVDVVAWVYRYARPVGTARVIEGGDYAAVAGQRPGDVAPGS